MPAGVSNPRGIIRGVTIDEMVTLVHEQKSAAVGVTPGQLIAANPNRVGLILFNDTTNSIVVGIDFTSITTTGFYVSNTLPAVFIRDSDFPGLAAQSWFGYVASGTSSLRYISVSVLGD